MIDASLEAALNRAIHTVPAGKWAVGVSGGADSIALLQLLRTRNDVELIVVHLNHQTRGDESDADEAFVQTLCAKANVRCRIVRRDALEATQGKRPANKSARFRALRFALFRNVVKSEGLRGVILAHHADDQAETVLQRLLRGAGCSSLAGIAPSTTVDNVRVIRPLLTTRRDALRTFLVDSKHSWREDSSNTSPDYLRNRLRAILRSRDDLTEALLDLSAACASLNRWAKQCAPNLDEQFAIGQLDQLPAILARRSAGDWLKRRGVPAGLIDRAVIDRLRTMCADAATASRQQFPGGVFVRRRAGIISAG
ncbi:hypothetical protein BH09PLA1_BH09PLA1_24070 [soil metagenome]